MNMSSSQINIKRKHILLSQSFIDIVQNLIEVMQRIKQMHATDFHARLQDTFEEFYVMIYATAYNDTEFKQYGEGIIITIRTVGTRGYKLVFSSNQLENSKFTRFSLFEVVGRYPNNYILEFENYEIIHKCAELMHQIYKHIYKK